MHRGNDLWGDQDEGGLVHNADTKHDVCAAIMPSAVINAGSSPPSLQGMQLHKPLLGEMQTIPKVGGWSKWD